jgi:hypothetical protein
MENIKKPVQCRAGEILLFIPNNIGVKIDFCSAHYWAKHEKDKWLTVKLEIKIDNWRRSLKTTLQVAPNFSICNQTALFLN